MKNRKSASLAFASHPTGYEVANGSLRGTFTVIKNPVFIEKKTGRSAQFTCFKIRMKAQFNSTIMRV